MSTVLRLRHSAVASSHLKRAMVTPFLLDAPLIQICRHRFRLEITAGCILRWVTGRILGPRDQIPMPLLPSRPHSRLLLIDTSWTLLSETTNATRHTSTLICLHFLMWKEHTWDTFFSRTHNTTFPVCTGCPTIISITSPSSSAWSLQDDVPQASVLALSFLSTLSVSNFIHPHGYIYYLHVCLANGSEHSRQWEMHLVRDSHTYTYMCSYVSVYVYVHI